MGSCLSRSISSIGADGSSSFGLLQLLQDVNQFCFSAEHLVLKFCIAVGLGMVLSTNGILYVSCWQQLQNLQKHLLIPIRMTRRTVAKKNWVKNGIDFVG